MTSIAHVKLEYAENGQVVDHENHEEKLAKAMKARRARRDEVIGVGTFPASRASVKGTLKIPRIDKAPEDYNLIKVRTALLIMRFCFTLMFI